MKFLQQLITLLPIIAGATDNKIDDLIAELVKRGEAELQRRMDATGGTRAEVLAAGAKKYPEVISKIDAALALGHAEEIPNPTEVE